MTSKEFNNTLKIVHDEFVMILKKHNLPTGYTHADGDYDTEDKTANYISVSWYKDWDYDE